MLTIILKKKKKAKRCRNELNYFLQNYYIRSRKKQLNCFNKRLVQFTQWKTCKEIDVNYYFEGWKQSAVEMNTVISNGTTA